MSHPVDDPITNVVMILKEPEETKEVVVVTVVDRIVLKKGPLRLVKETGTNVSNNLVSFDNSFPLLILCTMSHL